MNVADWHGVIPALTTPFHADLSIDEAFLRRHASLMMEAGCTGIVSPGSLGEGSAITAPERVVIWRTLREALGSKGRVIGAIASASTAEAVAAARDAERCGCDGLMVLPPYVYRGTWRETRHHVSAIMQATPLSCMLYNNPLAYGIDFTPEHIAELASLNPTFHAVKESSTDVRRFAAIRELVVPRLALLAGVDDVIVEAVAAGACGWIAGLVNALPVESVRLFELARAGKAKEADELRMWFLPLLRMDTTFDFVQLVKLVQARTGLVNAAGSLTRPPRLMPEGDHLRDTLATIDRCLARRPRR
jgi:4-hydroxy-tetrahydrodipicolinate synthase